MSVRFATSKSQILFYICLFFICGILVNSFWYKSWIYIPLFLIFAIILFLFDKRKKGIIFIFLILAFVLGLTKSTLAWSYQPDLISEKEIGMVLGDPKQGEASSSFILKSDEKILVIAGKHVDVKDCDVVEIEGSIGKIENEFRGILAKDGVYLRSFYPEVRVIKREGCRSLFTFFKNRTKETIRLNLSSPQSSILKAMLLGEKDEIPRNWQEKLSLSGVRHITAVSGMHVAVITVIFLNIAGILGLKRRDTLIIAFLAISFFVIMTGAQPSAIRAGFMGLIVLTSQSLGRQSNSIRTLFLIAALMLFLNPLLLRYDIGFQLSFAAVAGIITFSGFFKNFFEFLPPMIKEIMAVSFSAHVFTFPILGYYFGEVSLVFPIVNLLILPTLYWIMSFGVVFIIISFFSPFLAAVISFPLSILLLYLTKIVDFFSRFSWSSVEMTMVVFILYLVCLHLLFQKKKKRESDSDWAYSF